MQHLHYKAQSPWNQGESQKSLQQYYKAHGKSSLIPSLRNILTNLLPWKIKKSCTRLFVRKLRKSEVNQPNVLCNVVPRYCSSDIYFTLQRVVFKQFQTIKITKKIVEKGRAIQLGKPQKTQQSESFLFAFYFFLLFFLFPSFPPSRSNELSPFNETPGGSFLADSLLFRANRWWQVRAIQPAHSRAFKIITFVPFNAGMKKGGVGRCLAEQTTFFPYTRHSISQSRGNLWFFLCRQTLLCISFRRAPTQITRVFPFVSDLKLNHRIIPVLPQLLCPINNFFSIITHSLAIRA